MENKKIIYQMLFKNDIEEFKTIVNSAKVKNIIIGDPTCINRFLYWVKSEKTLKLLKYLKNKNFTIYLFPPPIIQQVYFSATIKSIIKIKKYVNFVISSDMGLIKSISTNIESIFYGEISNSRKSELLKNYNCVSQRLFDHCNIAHAIKKTRTNIINTIYIEKYTRILSFNTQCKWSYKCNLECLAKKKKLTKDLCLIGKSVIYKNTNKSKLKIKTNNDKIETNLYNLDNITQIISLDLFSKQEIEDILKSKNKSTK